MKVFKNLILGSFVIVILAILAAVILILTLDPNRLKPILEKGAADYGLELKMAGDISWQLYPKLGLSLGAIELSHKETGQLMSSVKQTKATVQLMPLFKKQILVDGVELDGLQLIYTTKADGSNLWSSVISATTDEAPAPTPADEVTDAPTVEVKKVRISNSVLNYKDEQSKQQATILISKLNADDITLDGKVFPLDLSITADYNDLPSTQLNLKTTIALNLDQQSLNIPLSKLNVVTGGESLNVDVSTSTSWAEPLASEGSLQLKSFDLPSLLKAFSIEPPVTSNTRALKNVTAAFDYKLKGEQVTLKNIDLGVDEFKLKGQLSVNSFSAPRIVLDMKGTDIILDDYLPPKTQAVPAQASVEAAPVPLPMEALRSLNLDAKILIDQMTYSGLALTKNQVTLSAKKGLISLQELSSNVADGSINLDGVLDAKGKAAKLNANLSMQNINLGTLLHTFAELDQLQGLANGKLLVTSQGTTDKELIDNLSINGNIESESLNITPFNVEQQFCGALALLQSTTSPSHDWPKKTELEPVHLKFSMINNNIKVESLSAEIAHLTGAADGTVNLSTGAFDFPIQLSLGDFAGDIKGCLPIEEKWRKKQLPLRCKGNLSDIGAKTCLPDTKLMGNLLKDKVKAKVEEKKQEEIDKVENKAKEKAQELLKKQLGDDNVKEAEDSLRGLFKKFKDK